MTKLAIAAPSKTGIGPLMIGTVAQDSVSVNQWNLEALSVNEKHIAPASISTEKLVIGAVTSVIIEDGSVSADKIAAATITGNKIAANTIQGSNIQSDTITGTQIYGSTLSAISANLGTVTAGTLNLVDGSNTGIYISPVQILAKVGGTTKLNFDVVGGTYYVAGEILANKVTITSNAANSVNFGADITIGGNVYMETLSAGEYNKIYWDGSGGTRLIFWSSTNYFTMINGDASGRALLQAGGGASYPAGTYVMASAGTNTVYVAAGTISLAGAVSGVTTLSMSGALSGATTISCSSNITATGSVTAASVFATGGYGNFAVCQASHKTAAGAQKADGSFSFYAAASGGGAINRLHEVTFSGGLITSWSATAI